MPLQQQLTALLLFIGTLCMAGTLTGCQPAIDTGPDADEVAIAFFDRLYNQRELEHALALTTTDYHSVLERYGTINAISRYVFNMNFDEVVIEADTRGISLYRERAETARLQLSFRGTRYNQRVETLRDVVLVRENGRWRISKVMDVL